MIDSDDYSSVAKDGKNHVDNAENDFQTGDDVKRYRPVTWVFVLAEIELKDINNGGTVVVTKVVVNKLVGFVQYVTPREERIHGARRINNNNFRYYQMSQHATKNIIAQLEGKMLKHCDGIRWGCPFLMLRFPFRSERTSSIISASAL